MSTLIRGIFSIIFPIEGIPLFQYFSHHNDDMPIPLYYHYINSICKILEKKMYMQYSGRIHRVPFFNMLLYQMEHPIFLHDFIMKCTLLPSFFVFSGEPHSCSWMLPVTSWVLLWFPGSVSDLWVGVWVREM